MKNQYENATYETRVNTFRTEMLILAILHVSAWGCLIRSDYNFVFLMFAYFYLISTKDDPRSINIIFILVIILQVMDFIFYIFIPQSWFSFQEGNWVWNNLHGMYVFALIIAIVVSIMKFPLIYFLYQHKKVLGNDQ